MIWGCLRCQNPESSIGYFSKLVLSNAKPDSITLSVIISACHDLGNPNIGKSIHCWGFKRGFGNAHISQCNSLISFYSKINDIEYACEVFEGLVIRDLVSWNSIINAFIENERLSKAFGLLDEMELDGFKPNSVIVVTLISAFSKSKLLEHGQFIHGFFVHCWGFRRGFGNAHISQCNSLISFYSQINDIEYACKVFEGLVIRDLVSWNSMINAFIENERLSKAFGLLEEMELDSFKPDSVIVVTLISACSKSNCWTMASLYMDL
ncbi:hypothetical protein AMTRI_Chr08g164460 [Amborella trichopoda]